LKITTDIFFITGLREITYLSPEERMIYSMLLMKMMMMLFMTVARVGMKFNLQSGQRRGLAYLTFPKF
jgi:hypothetical protein